jgi:hypothetical protein
LKGKSKHVTKIRREEGTATLEVAIMLPLYTFTIVTLIFFGVFHQQNTKILKTVQLFSQTPGEQDYDDLPEDLKNVQTAGYANIYGIKPEDIDDQISHSLYEDDDLLEMFIQNQHKVTGSYRLEGNEIVYTTTVHDTRWTELIETYDLTALNDVVESEMDDWLERSETSIQAYMGMPFTRTPDGKTEIDFESEDFMIDIHHSHTEMIRRENPLYAPGTLHKRSTAKERALDSTFPKQAIQQFTNTQMITNPSSVWQKFWIKEED